jgi:hypothetical protein
LSKINNSELNFPVTRKEKDKIYLAILIALVGYLAELWFDNNFFERSGSLIVCLGVLSFSFNTDNVYLSRFQEYADRIIKQHIDNENEKSMKALEGFEPLKEAAKKKLDEGMDKIRSAANNSRDAITLRRMHIEASIIVSGTFIWGFGHFFVFDPIEIGSIITKLFS